MDVQTDVRGLNDAQVKNQFNKYGPNILPENQPKTLFFIIFSVVSEPMFSMLLIAGAIYLALGDPAEAIFLLTGFNKCRTKFHKNSFQINHPILLLL